jgi:hypothetical protein
MPNNLQHGDLCSTALFFGLGWFVPDLSGQRIGSIFKGRDHIIGIFIPENVTDTLSRNASNKPTYAMQQPSKAKIKKTSHNLLLISLKKQIDKKNLRKTRVNHQKDKLLSKQFTHYVLKELYNKTKKLNRCIKHTK